MTSKEIKLLNLNQMQSYIYTKNNAEKQYKDFYKEHTKDINNTYFYHKGIGVYCKMNPVTENILCGVLNYIHFFIGQNFQTSLPSVYERSGSFKIEKLNFDEIEILSKEEFVDGLKKQLQDALDNM